MLDKSALRAKMLEQRKMVNPIQRVSDAALLIAQFVMSVRLPIPMVIGGYWAVGSEMPTHDLLVHCQKAGHIIGLPTGNGDASAPEAGRSMAFRQWFPDADMHVGTFNVPEPDGVLVTPALLLVPLLAFDARGGRLGRGGGYYDQYVNDRRQSSDVCTLGLAFSSQEVENCPLEAHDARLDAIITPRDIHWVNKSAFTEIGMSV